MTGVKMTLYMLAIPLEKCKIILLLRFVTCYNDFIAIQFYLLKKAYGSACVPFLILRTFWNFVEMLSKSVVKQNYISSNVIVISSYIDK